MTLSRLLSACVLGLSLSACAGGLLPGEQSAERKVQTSPADDGTVRLAEATRQGGDLSAAANLYQQVLKRHPENMDARLGLAQTLMASGEVERARLTYAEGVKLAPQSMEPLLGLARIAVMRRDLEQADTLFTQAQKLAPDTDIRALYGLGVTRDMQGRSEEAQALYRQALAIHPEDVAVRNNLGLSLALNGDPRQAVNVLLEIATANGAPPQARQNLALAYGLIGNVEAAETVLASDLERSAVQNNLHYYDYLRGQGLARPAVKRDALP